jgi:hypothetical protein
MNLNVTRETFRAELAWLASQSGKMVKTGGITLSYAHRAPDPATGKRIYRSGEFVGLLSTTSGLWTRYQRAIGAFAQLVTNAAVTNASIVWTARTAGVGGNAITLALVNPGVPNSPLAVTVIATAISVSLETNAAAALVTTAAQLIQAIKDDPAANALVYGELARGHNGTGLIAAIAATNLTGGVASVGQQATLDTGVVGNNNAITHTAVNIGTAGDNIQVAHLDPGANSIPLSLAVVGSGTAADPYVVNVTLATDAGGVITSTAANVIELINNHGFARTIIRASNTGASTGAGVMVAAVAAPLAGGTDMNVLMSEGQFGILLHDVDVTNGNGIGAVLYGGKVLDARLPAVSDAYVRAALPMVAFTNENWP